MKPFGDPNPWAEPAWYNALDSPYYRESHRKLRAYIREYMESNVIPYADEWEESGHVPLEATVKFAQAGLSFPEIPQEYRPGVSLPAGVPDEEWDVFHLMILHDETSRAHCGALSGLMGSSTIGAPPIIHHGTSEQKQKWLPGIFTGETRLCLGSTEPTGGSDVANLKTTAVRSADGKHYIVNGHKKWITGALTASHMTTGVRTGGPGAGGISVLVIPTNLKGFSARKIHNSGNNAGGTAWVDLEDVHVPCENLIGPENKGFPIMMSSKDIKAFWQVSGQLITPLADFNSERFVMAVKMNRYARVCLADAVEYSHRRETFGKPLVAHQIIRHKFVTLARYVESHWAWLEQIAYVISKDYIDL
ncbi:hypothetical protein B0A52_00804 [Exophiala mesophila]|uniref:Acyl-CoA dehydrogenase n=1 Tax=Exophiala mesophila TaxID=212818 RepID=A0A438NIA0_EXOME|nr:hypothetical protein B0A52_00804 [Exophiala mesophila]